MKFKIDTREKFHVIHIQEPELSANMTADLENSLLSLLKQDVKNVVVILKDIQSIDDAAADKLISLQQYFYEHESSFVVCELQQQVETSLDEKGLLELLNVTPTESEAWDIVQMEEIERELLGGEEGL